MTFKEKMRENRRKGLENFNRNRERNNARFRMNLSKSGFSFSKCPNCKCEDYRFETRAESNKHKVTLIILSIMLLAPTCGLSIFLLIPALKNKNVQYKICNNCGYSYK